MSSSRRMGWSWRCRIRKPIRSVASAALLSIGALLAPIPHDAGAQEITGTVTERGGSALRDAIVRLSPVERTVRTDAGGGFRIEGLAPGSYALIVSKIGYRPDTAQVTVGSGRTRDLALSLERLSVLDPFVVNAMRALLPRVVDREERGLGEVMYAQEIAQMQRYDLTDLVRGSGRLALAAGPAPLLIVDGRIMPDYPYKWHLPGTPMSHLVPRPEEVAAVEVHRGFAGMRETDIWFTRNITLSTNRRLIVVWTKYYLELEERRRAEQEARRQRSP